MESLRLGMYAIRKNMGGRHTMWIQTNKACAPLRRRNMNKQAKSFPCPDPHHSFESSGPPILFLEISKIEEVEHS